MNEIYRCKENEAQAKQLMCVREGERGKEGERERGCILDGKKPGLEKVMGYREKRGWALLERCSLLSQLR